jgi:hypothetical protein
VHFALAKLVSIIDFGSVVKQIQLPVSGEKFAGKTPTQKFQQDLSPKAIVMPFGTVPGSGECPSLVQRVSSIFCTCGYASPRSLFHILFNTFVENCSLRGPKNIGTKFPIADFLCLNGASTRAECF